LRERERDRERERAGAGAAAGGGASAWRRRALLLRHQHGTVRRDDGERGGGRGKAERDSLIPEEVGGGWLDG